MDGDGDATGGDSNNFEGNNGTASYTRTDGTVVLQIEMARLHGMDQFFGQVDDSFTIRK